MDPFESLVEFPFESLVDPFESLVELLVLVLLKDIIKLGLC